MYCVLVFACIVLFLNPSWGDLPKTINIGEGENLFLFWKPTNESLVSCGVQTPAKSVDLLTDEGDVARVDRLPLDQGYCSLTVPELTSSHNGTWTLGATTPHKAFHASTRVFLHPKVKVLNSSHTIQDINSFDLYCGDENAVSCRLKSPKGELWSFYGPCHHSLFDISVADHEGVWLCSFTMDYFTREFKASTTIKVVQAVKKELSVEEVPGGLALSCVTPNKHQSARICKITTPYGLKLNLGEGMFFGHYQHYGSTPDHCGVFIPTPLAEQDVGPWRCEAHVSISSYNVESYGGYVTLGKEKKLREIEVPAKRVFWSGTYSSPELLCHVPYQIQYCWFRSPNGSHYTVRSDSSVSSTLVTSQGFKFGDCALQVPDSLLRNSSGTWTCNIGLVDREISHTFEVTYSDSGLIAWDKEVSVELGSPVKIGCWTPDGRGLAYCRLVRPDGKGFPALPGINSTSYPYAGKGLEHGDCSVNITSLSEADVGKWLCAVVLIDDYSNKEISTPLHVSQQKGKLIVVYAVVGVAGFFAAFGLVGLFVMRRRRISSRTQEDSVLCLVEEVQSTAPPLDS